MHTLIGQLESAGVSPYFSLFKIFTVLVTFVGWTFAAQWADRDADRVKTRREWWNLLVVGGGLGGLVVLVLFPWRGGAFYLGIAFWLILAGGTLIAYIVHRNGRMVPAARVMSRAHFERLLARVRGEKKAKVDKGIRVKLVGTDGKLIDKPDDVAEEEQFNAVQEFLFDMLWKRATDADVLVGEDAARLVYKIDGVVTEQENGVALDEAEKVFAFLKRSAGLNIEERRRPQSGTIRVGLLGTTTKPEALEVLTSGTTKGERMRLRLNRTAGLLKPEDLGFSEDQLTQFRDLMHKDTGLVLLAGPKESGITTTQYATIRAHDAYLQNIYSVEGKPLLKLDNITQQVFDEGQTDTTFARTFQTILRREPDVVMVDRCEDKETAQLACRAAAEKKIYMAIRAANSIDAITRIQTLTEDSKLVASALVGVVGQRLMRVLCEACREAYKPDDQLLHKANLPADQIEHFYRPPSSPILDKKGREIICQACQNSHYTGRTGVFEILLISDKIKALIAAGAPAKQIRGQARAEKMRYLQEHGLLKVIDGRTSMAEVMRGLRADGK